MSIVYGINYSTLYNRICVHNWPTDRALNTPSEKPNLKAMARKHGIKYSTLTMRIKKYHWSLEKALNTPPVKPTGKHLNSPEIQRNKINSLYVTLNGKKTYLKDACKIKGIKYQVVVNRMWSTGCSIEEAFNKDPNDKTKKTTIFKRVLACPYGHPYTKETTHFEKFGKYRVRTCLVCKGIPILPKGINK